MHAVILAAGRGTRLLHHTTDTPKPLVRVLGTPILERIIASLPPAISNIIVVTSYRETQIHDFCAAHPRAADIICISQPEMNGTYGAILAAQPLLNGTFLVTGGDDMHARADIETLIKEPRAFGVARRTGTRYRALALDETGLIAGLRPQTDDEKQKGALIPTGAYVLDMDFFNLPPIAFKTGEYGLPDTLIAAAERYPTRVVEMPKWLSINTPEDLVDVEEKLRDK